tara:strand:- start:62 stop:349 length:288 start_codon:yes stop_codon:yes gene_type:complete
MKKYYTIFVTEESDYHCERVVATYESESNLTPQQVFYFFLREKTGNKAWSASEGEIPNTNTSYVVEGITVSDSPVEFMSFDELYCDPSNRLGEAV